MMRNMEVQEHYLSGTIPAEIAENLKEYFPEHDDPSYEEFLQHQESVYQSIQANGRNGGRTSDYGHSSNQIQFSGQEGESSRGGNAKPQIDTDEALARLMQELGEDFDDIYFHEHSGTAAASTEINPTETPVTATSQDLRQDDVDPDSMTYEQLQSLVETVGNESKGLSEELISQLPTFKYKVGGMFSKKKKNEECVICLMAYNYGERLTTLPCAHQYHSKCVTRWLKQNKQCPICQTEVGDD